MFDPSLLFNRRYVSFWNERCSDNRPTLRILPTGSSAFMWAYSDNSSKKATRTFCVTDTLVSLHLCSALNGSPLGHLLYTICGCWEKSWDALSRVCGQRPQGGEWFSEGSSLVSVVFEATRCGGPNLLPCMTGQHRRHAHPWPCLRQSLPFLKIETSIIS